MLTSKYEQFINIYFFLFFAQNIARLFVAIFHKIQAGTLCKTLCVFPFLLFYRHFKYVSQPVIFWQTP